MLPETRGKTRPLVSQKHPKFLKRKCAVRMSAEGRPEGCWVAATLVKVRRPLSRPTSPAPHAAARTASQPGQAHAALGDRPEPSRIGKARERGRGGRYFPGQSSHKGPGLRKRRRRNCGDPNTEPQLTLPGPAAASTSGRDCACASAPPAGRGGASCARPHVWGGGVGAAPRVAAHPELGVDRAGPGRVAPASCKFAGLGRPRLNLRKMLSRLLIGS